ncbi:hypothetical protein D3C78_1876710 [compost metagenome]
MTTIVRINSTRVKPRGCMGSAAAGLDADDARIPAQIGQARQGNGGEDSEHHYYQSQFNQGEATLSWHANSPCPAKSASSEPAVG